MNRYRDLSRVVSIFAIAIAVFLGNFGSEWLRTKQVSSLVVLSLSILIVVIASQIIRIIIEQILSRSKWLTKLWLGDQAIDGYWFEAITKDGETVFYTINSVRTNLPTLRIGGDNYSIDGNRTGNHQTETVVIDWPAISYTSTSQRNSRPNPLTPSYGQLRLEENPNGPPHRWSGLFVDVFEGSIYQFEGWRIKDPLFLKELSDPERRSMLVPILVKRYFQNHLKVDERVNDKKLGIKN